MKGEKVKNFKGFFPNELIFVFFFFLHIPRMRENVVKLSNLMRDRRHHPMDDALWLLEYVGRTGGADHLKLASRHLNTLQYFSLDCLAVVILTLLVTKYAVKKLVRVAKRRNAKSKSD